MGDGFLLVETQVGAASERFVRDGVALARSGSPVSLLLTGDAVATAVAGASEALVELIRAGGEVWVDDFVLTQRAVPPWVLADGVVVVGMDRAASALLAAGVRTVWH